MRERTRLCKELMARRQERGPSPVSLVLAETHSRKPRPRLRRRAAPWDAGRRLACRLGRHRSQRTPRPAPPRLTRPFSLPLSPPLFGVSSLALYHLPRIATISYASQLARCSCAVPRMPLRVSPPLGAHHHDISSSRVMHAAAACRKRRRPLPSLRLDNNTIAL